MKEENLIFIEEAMKYPEVIRQVSEASDRIWYKISNAASFEHDCYRDIGKEILEKGVKTIGGLANYTIRRKEAYHIKYEAAEDALSIESLAGRDDDGEEMAFEVEDELVDIEREVSLKGIEKEIVNTLAKGDDLLTAILNARILGYENDTELSRVLADSFDMKASGIRRRIQRFKKECEKRVDEFRPALAS